MTTVTEPGAADLAALQRAFHDHVLGECDSLLALIGDGPRADRRTLAAVYRNGYALRLVEALENDFPGLVAVAGRDTFDKLARAYIAAHSSRHASLRWFGRELAAFLASTAPWRDQPALAEMAGFEWVLGEAWDAPDAQPVQAAALFGVPPEAWGTLSFAPVPSLRRVTLRFDVPQAWQRREASSPEGMPIAVASAGPVIWFVWRDAVDVQYRALDRDEAALLDGLIAGDKFPDLCVRLPADGDESQAVTRAAGLLRAWVEAGLVGSFQYEGAIT